MTVIFLPKQTYKHTNTFRHIEPNWTSSRARFTLVANWTANTFAFTEPDESKSLRFRTKLNRDRSKSCL